jgi:hypothetical protein
MLGSRERRKVLKHRVMEAPRQKHNALSAASRSRWRLEGMARLRQRARRGRSQ